jgi:uncharacterized protein
MKTFLTILLCLLGWTIQAEELPQPLSPRQLVHDYTRLFTAKQQATLEQHLQRFHDTTSTQIAVAVVPTLQGMAANSYAQQLAEKWGIGQKGKDNGILIVIKPKSQREKGEVAIAVGYGLEGVVPDAIASRIIRNEMIPSFQQGDYYTGTIKAIGILMQLSAGEFTAEQYAKKGKSGSGFSFFLLFFIFFLLPLFLRRRRGYTTGSHGTSQVPPIIIGGWGSGRGSDFGSFSSGSGTFGGFGGFGGGSFGGGGASGSW